MWAGVHSGAPAPLRACHREAHARVAYLTMIHRRTPCVEERVPGVPAPFLSPPHPHRRRVLSSGPGSFGAPALFARSTGPLGDGVQTTVCSRIGPVLYRIAHRTGRMGYSRVAQKRSSRKPGSQPVRGTPAPEGHSPSAKYYVEVSPPNPEGDPCSGPGPRAHYSPAAGKRSSRKLVSYLPPLQGPSIPICQPRCLLRGWTR